jgi:hypothetical protein
MTMPSYFERVSRCRRACIAAGIAGIDSVLRQGSNDLPHLEHYTSLIRCGIRLHTVRLLRLIVIGWMLLWLAGNGALAVAMPYCQHGMGEHVDAALAQDGTLLVQHQLHASHQHDHRQHVANTMGASGDHQALNIFCDSCDLCHLAVSGPIAASSSEITPVKPAHPTGSDVTIPSRFIEQPQPVPLATRA